MMMLDLNAEGTRFMVVRAGCFGYGQATVAFNPTSVQVIDVERIMRSKYPRLFEGSDCETCGYDFPEFAENYSMDDDEIHRHSPETCGFPVGYMEDERFLRVLNYNNLYATDTQDYVEELENLGREDAQNAPREENALKSWIADREMYYPSEDCRYNLTFSLKGIYNDTDGDDAPLYAVNRWEDGHVSVIEMGTTLRSVATP